MYLIVRWATKFSLFWFLFSFSLTADSKSYPTHTLYNKMLVILQCVCLSLSRYSLSILYVFPWNHFVCPRLQKTHIYIRAYVYSIQIRVFLDKKNVIVCMCGHHAQPSQKNAKTIRRTYIGFAPNRFYMIAVAAAFIQCVLNKVMKFFRL